MGSGKGKEKEKRKERMKWREKKKRRESKRSEIENVEKKELIGNLCGVVWCVVRCVMIKDISVRYLALM